MFPIQAGKEEDPRAFAAVWAGPVKVHVTIAGNFISHNVNGISVGKTSNVVAQVSPVT